MKFLKQYFVYVFWMPYFKNFRWVLFSLPLLFAYSGFLLANFKLATRGDLEQVQGTYQVGLLGAKTDTYPVKVKTQNDEVLMCNCDPGGRRISNCFSENKTKNREIHQRLNGQHVEVLMSRKKFYEYNRVCYEISAAGKIFVSYEKLYHEYSIWKNEYNFDRLVYFAFIIMFLCISGCRSIIFLRLTLERGRCQNQRQL